jgi:hypothetical protein
MRDFMKDDEPTPEEQREAEALARALAGERPDAAAPPPEALEAAALLRHARSGGQLDPARQQALAERLRAELGPRPRRRRSPWLWLLAPLGAGAAAALILAVGAPRPRELPRLTTLPPPAPSLLAAQARAARGQPAALASLDAQMRSYRRELHERLRSSGGGR